MLLRLGDCTSATWTHQASGAVVGVRVGWLPDEAVSRDPTDEYVIYINGTLVGNSMTNTPASTEQTQTIAIPQTDSPSLSIAGSSSSSNTYLHASISEVTLLFFVSPSPPPPSPPALPPPL